MENSSSSLASVCVVRQAVKAEDGQWKIHHLRGEHLLADGLTKVLMGQSFSRFCEKRRMFQGELPSSRKVQCWKPKVSHQGCNGR